MQSESLTCEAELGNDSSGLDGPTNSSATWEMPATERKVLLGALLVSCIVFSCSLTLADPDLWGHTLYGLRAIEQGVATERFDPFSYTAPSAVWVNHERGILSDLRGDVGGAWPT